MDAPPETASPHPILVLAERLDTCWGAYRTELKRIRGEFAEEYVHDLRISIRRLIAVMDMGRAIAHRKKVRKSRQLLKAYIDSFDKLRDAQVQLVIVEEMQAELPEVAPYVNRLREREKQQVKRLKKRVNEFSASELSQQVKRLEAALRKKAAPETEDAIWAVMDEAYATLRERRAAANPAYTATIHQTRLAFKKFRYQAETVQPLLAGAPEDLLRRLHEYQSAMGEIQDAEVGLQMLDAFTTKRKQELPAVRARFVEMHQERIAAFMAQIDNLQTFWRPTPEQPFPWETAKSE